MDGGDALSADRTAQLAREQATVGMSELGTYLLDSGSAAPTEPGEWVANASAILGARALRAAFVDASPGAAGAVDRYIRYLETGQVQVPPPPTQAVHRAS